MMTAIPSLWAVGSVRRPGPYPAGSEGPAMRSVITRKDAPRTPGFPRRRSSWRAGESDRDEGPEVFAVFWTGAPELCILAA
jgi:hypothetical protein